MDDPKLIERYDTRLAELITQMHNDGMELSAITFLLDQKLGNLKMIESASADLGCMTTERLKAAIESHSAVD